MPRYGPHMSLMRPDISLIRPSKHLLGCAQIPWGHICSWQGLIYLWWSMIHPWWSLVNVDEVGYSSNEVWCIPYDVWYTSLDLWLGPVTPMWHYVDLMHVTPLMCTGILQHEPYMNLIRLDLPLMRSDAHNISLAGAWYIEYPIPFLVPDMPMMKTLIPLSRPIKKMWHYIDLLRT